MNIIDEYLDKIVGGIFDDFLRADTHWSAVMRANKRFGQRVTRANRHKWRRCYLLERQLGHPRVIFATGGSVKSDRHTIVGQAGPEFIFPFPPNRARSLAGQKPTAHNGLIAGSNPAAPTTITLSIQGHEEA